MAGIAFAAKTSFQTGGIARAMEAAVRAKALQAAHVSGAQAVTKIASLAAARTNPRAPGRSRSQSLTNPGSYRYGVEALPNGASFFVEIAGDDLFRVKFFSVNFGSRGGYPITPHGNYKLAFPWPTEGSPYVFRRRVNHPGVRSGRHFYDDAIKEIIRAIPGQLS